MKTIRKALPFLIAASSLPGVALADAPQYTLTDIGPSVRFGAFTGVFAVNSSGAIMGNGGDGTYSHAFLYNGTTHDLGTLGGSNSASVAMNSSNNVVGYSDTTGNTETHAFMYNGVIHDLGTLGGTYSVAQAINSTNTVVGYANTTDDNAQHGFYYDSAMHDIGTLGGNYSSAFAINDHGIIVGSATIDGDTESHAIMYNGVMHDLGTLGGTSADAVGVSSNGIIAGTSFIAGDNFQHAFFYDGAMHDLGTLGGDNSGAFATNANGWVLGWSEINPGDSLSTVFLYDGKKMYDLNALLANAFPNLEIDNIFGNISDTGEIFAQATDLTTGDLRLYSFSPASAVPIPASAWLFSSCLTGLIGLRRKSKNE